MSTQFETTRDAVLQQLMGTVKGVVPTQEEMPFWTDVAGLFATEKLRYDTAATPEDKAKVSENLTVIQETIKLRLARKELQVRNTIEGVVTMVMKTAVNQFFPGVGLLLG